MRQLIFIIIAPPISACDGWQSFCCLDELCYWRKNDQFQICCCHVYSIATGLVAILNPALQRTVAVLKSETTSYEVNLYRA